jgi:hypothetical protein
MKIVKTTKQKNSLTHCTILLYTMSDYSNYNLGGADLVQYCYNKLEFIVILG